MSEVLDTPAAAPAAAAPAAAPAAPAAPAAAPAEPSALAKPVPLHERFPEKFRVMKAGEKGEEFDAEASTAKVLEAYGSLEKRLGSGDAPPKAPEEYAVTLPDELKETLKDFNLSPEFRKQAHELGITQKQLDAMLGHYFKEAPALMQGGVQNQVDAVIGNLEKAWGDKYDDNLKGAMKAFDAYADPEDKGKFDEIMRSPALAYKILAKISGELGEARGVPAVADSAAGDTAESMKQLTLSEAANNPKHPDHKATRAKLDAWYAKHYGTAPVS